MPKYIVGRPKKIVRSILAEDDIFYGRPVIDILYVSDHDTVETGLLDKDGEPIYRAPLPMGFGKDDDW